MQSLLGVLQMDFLGDLKQNPERKEDEEEKHKFHLIFVLKAVSKVYKSAFVDEKVFNVLRRVLSPIVPSLIYNVEDVLNKRCYNDY